MPRHLGYNNGPIRIKYATRLPKINLTSDQHPNSYDNIVAEVTNINDKNIGYE